MDSLLYGRSFCASRLAVRLAVFASAAFLTATLAVSASERAHISFDVQPLVACRDVTTPEHLGAHPDERLMEVRFQVSALVSGDQTRLMEYFYRFDCQHSAVEILDYEPKTKLASRYAEKISFENKDELSKSIGVSVKGDVGSVATGTAGADAGTKKQSLVRYALRPPMETVAASGTLARRRSVYFKLRSTPQQTLEGAKEFSVVLRVAKQWQADFATLECEARCRCKPHPLAKPDKRECASQQFLLVLFEAGNGEAEALAERLSQTEEALRDSAIANHKAVSKRAFPSIVHRVGAAMDLYEPQVPKNWVRLVIGGSPKSMKPVREALPDEVRAAVTEYWQARDSVASLRN